MAEKLSDLFERAQSSSVLWNGQRVYSMYELSRIEDGARLQIDFDDPSPARPEGLRLRIRGGALEIAGQTLDDVVLWSDSAPQSVEAKVKAEGGVANLRVWNCWRDTAGSLQARIGNAGMLVDESTAGITLRCSDGFDDVTFDDMVATVRITKSDRYRV